MCMNVCYPNYHWHHCRCYTWCACHICQPAFHHVPVVPAPQVLQVPVDLKPGKLQINIEVKRELTKKKSARW